MVHRKYQGGLELRLVEMPGTNGVKTRHFRLKAGVQTKLQLVGSAAFMDLRISNAKGAIHVVQASSLQGLDWQAGCLPHSWAVLHYLCGGQ